MYLLLFVLFFLIVNLLWLWYLKNLRKYDIPGPVPLPIVGNTLELGRNGKENLEAFLNLTKIYGHFYKVYLGTDMRLVCFKPEILEMVLQSSTHLSKTNLYEFFRPIIGDGLLISGGQKWRERRKLITPTFHFKILEDFLKIFDSAADILLEKLSENVGDAFDVYPVINRYSLDVICESAMGVKVNAQENQEMDYANAIRTVLTTVVRRTFSFWEKFEFLFKFSPVYKAHNEAVKVTHNFTDKIIKRKREEYKNKLKNLNKDNQDDNFGNKKRVALLDMLLDSENSNLLSNKDLRDELDTFVFEGHDTTTAGVTFSLYALSTHPDIQEKVFEEISSLPNDDITIKDIQSLKYLDLFVKEVERMYPSVPLMERALEEDTVIEGIKFPKGTCIMMFIYVLHHLEEYFPEPEKFNPDRFLPENRPKSNFAYIPFSAGPRNCIGQKFALLEIKLTLIKILRKFEILPAPNFKPIISIVGTLGSENGIRIKLKPRL